MKNRKLPFGYQMVLGEVVCHPQEAELVRHIYRQYIAGAGYQTLAEEMERRGVPYDAGRPWNKNMVARLLEDTRYTGQRGFPPVISEDTLRSAAEMRTTKQTPCQMTPAQKALRQLSGQRATRGMEEQTLALLNGLIRHPEQITTPMREADGTENHDRELNAVLRQIPIDEERARALIFQCAQERYQRIGTEEYETDRLRRIFAKVTPMERLDADLLRAAVAAVKMDGRRVSLRLKNGQIITGREQA